MKKVFLSVAALTIFALVSVPAMAQTCTFDHLGGQYSLRKQKDGSYSGIWTEYNTRRVATVRRYINGQLTFVRFSGGEQTISVGNKCA